MNRLAFLAAMAVMLFLPALASAQTQQKINKKNLVIKEWNTSARSNRKILDHATTYNAEGQKIEEIEYTTEGQKWRKRYEYDGAGKASRELVYNERNKLVEVKKFEYNEFGRKKVQYLYNASGKLMTIKVFEYITEDA